MTKKLVLGGLAAVAVWLALPQTQQVIVVGSKTVVVQRAEFDGLDGVAQARLAFGPTAALAGCASWDIKENCCPAGCAAKKGTNWTKADDILRGCMRGLGCSENETKSATVFLKCDCPK